MPTDAVIVAAGSSTRFGAGDKLTADLRGRPVLAWSLAAFEAADGIGSIVVVCSAGREAEVESLGRTWAPTRFQRAVTGGERRRDSVEAGLRACASRYVAIHDGARPLVTADLIARTLAAADKRSGAIAALPVTDTIKEVAGGFIAGHPERGRLYTAQTPQVVLRQAWLQAAASSDNDETDDAAMLSRLGLEVAIARGDPSNLKITRPLDLDLARLLLDARGWS